MSHRFVRCPHCKMPHDAAVRVCPSTGFALPENVRPARANVSSRMSEEPPPSRRPEPLAFDPGGANRSRRAPVPSPAPERSRRSSEAQPAASRGKPALPATGHGDIRRELVGRTVGGRYLIKGVLGEGGMGTVFDAEHLGLSRQVAIKVLSPSQAKKKVAVKRFQQEARAAGAIGHPNICEVYDLGLLDDGSPYLVMEKLVGQTLADRIANEGGLPFDEVVEIVGQVLSGLIAAHEKGIVHRDIKPENIFLARRVGCPPIIKLLDFGVSKMMAEFQTSDDALDLTRTGMVMGTPYYMSPEQARGERNLDGRVDVYACGVVMYEAITGKRPFLAPNYNALLLAIINTSPQGICEVRPATPPELEAIILRAMQRNRADRYASAKDMLRDLVPPIAETSANRPSSPPGAGSVADARRTSMLGRGPMNGDSATRMEPVARPQASAMRHSPNAPRDGASAMLRNRMTEAARGVPNNTRREAKAPPQTTQPFDPIRRVAVPAEDGVEIPIHITNVTGLDDFEPDDGPTAIFEPRKHGLPVRPAPRQPSSPRKETPPPPPPHFSSSIPPPMRMPSSAPPPKQSPPSHVPPANARPLATPKAPLEPRTAPVQHQEWEAETVVKSPPPFNPEQTMKIEGIELDRLERRDNRRAPPRRR